MDSNHLSERLKTVASYVPLNSRMADIGSDHAYLPVYLAKNNKISYAIAGEVAKGPLENAEHEITLEHLDGVILPRLADGLDAINLSDNINCITIAGMGGTLIRDILERGKNKLNGKEKLILQPNVGELVLRMWLMNNYYKITNEDIIREDGHTYEIIVAEKVDSMVLYDKDELQFGPFLLRAKSQTFVDKWHNEQLRMREVINQMNQAKKHRPIDRINAIEDKISKIDEVLKSERN
ncbi:tRNA (adenine(22)-N(1))-methyltransferase [Apilactobacillus xinyiensis]|uniref:tRNA (Adenine(22)-N(1))-methyltransferase TrmK n=1 Tax=Apilactobacillus xinyiensis TaxID=2841032 RepID=A0ABT0I146_9LACO|nr:tRNA (adenine(22)-N(1))-methyltransferase TrmK [Apilactobacillus xinyiensis]MCK8624069.1 tRNA (adenine(22)-N(1))-methyltransferase TrmK [Apilactobacillus xinyiensis]MCL0311661.1 tRNA (adenine(22)-N(1))-methyltransferase TrmK [Apilactobacillus xinyiensis]MCL0318194.1 tRNA (adenine(22)-N(1))-methyltransferase TrmK [Apilactobacillus xinyiensis]MCL0329347.1 tRNA (adenine(22)-N(1))-methyltransferase TrmK [Apilactobacillus xinyiensis]